MPLNPNLYDLLCQRFRHVKIANEGESMAAQHHQDPLTGRTVLDIHSWGESYNICCPFCNDTRQRLSVNHRYGVHDPVTDSDNLTLVRCFNEDCLKDPRHRTTLKEKVFGFLNRDQRRRILVVQRGNPPASNELALKEARPPGRVVELADLPEDHPALVYLRGRGFDPAELSSVWRVLYCPEADPRYPLAQDRLIIPIMMNGVWVGWQARFVGERPWKQERLPKYVTMPGFPKHLVLYNHDLARQQPAVVVCEGPSDVWRVGPCGVALHGKQASRSQLKLLVKDWGINP